MPGVRLSQSRIEALEARKLPCDIRDTELTGFDVRVLPSGGNASSSTARMKGCGAGRAGHRHHYGQQGMPSGAGTG